MKILRLIGIWCWLALIVTLFHLAATPGGHAHALYEPIDWFLCACIYAVAFWPTGIWKGSLPVRQRQNRISVIAFLGVAMPLFIPRAIHFTDYDNRDSVVIHLQGFANIFVTAVLAFLAMECWFFIEDRIAAKKGAGANPALKRSA